MPISPVSFPIWQCLIKAESTSGQTLTKTRLLERRVAQVEKVEKGDFWLRVRVPPERARFFLPSVRGSTGESAANLNFGNIFLSSTLCNTAEERNKPND
mmetsp:Transcript_37583/g.49535  ORF Transcript_37583/g.49535 Transcript_37583/m.49535 type:complete len:99 (-) Transcript_37583:45-341(-)